MFKRISDSRKLIKGVSFSWIRFALTTAIGFFQTPLLFHNLSKEQVSFWYVFFLFGAFLQMADLGLVQTLSRLIAYIDNSSKDGIEEKTIADLANYSTKEIYITALVSFTTILVLVSILVIGMYFVFYQGNNATEIFKISFTVYVIGIVFNLLSNVPSAILIGYRDVGTESIIRSIFQIVYFIGLLVFLPLFKSILIVACMFMLQNFCQLVALHVSLLLRHQHIFKKEIGSKYEVQLSIAKQIYTQSFPLVINQFGGWLISQGSVLTASIVVGATRISDYAINQQLFTYVTAIALVINQALGPFIAKQYIQDKLDGLQTLFKNTMIVCLSIVGVMLIILLSCGDRIIALWVGESHFLGVSFAMVFGMITFLEVQHSVAGNFVWNTGSWPFNKWTLGAGVLTVVLGYTLGQLYGLIGIAVATLLSRLLTLNWYVVYFALKRLRVSIRNFIYTIFSPLTISTIVCIVIAVFLKEMMISEDYKDVETILVVSLASTLIFTIIVYLLFFKAFKALFSTINFSKSKK